MNKSNTLYADIKRGGRTIKTFEAYNFRDLDWEGILKHTPIDQFTIHRYWFEWDEKELTRHDIDTTDLSLKAYLTRQAGYPENTKLRDALAKAGINL